MKRLWFIIPVLLLLTGLIPAQVFLPHRHFAIASAGQGCLTASNLIACWNMNEVSTTTVVARADSISPDVPLVPQASQVVSTNGLISNSVYIPGGASGYLVGTNAPKLTVATTNDLTFSLWAYPSITNTANAVVKGLRSSSIIEYAILIFNGKWRFEVANGVGLDSTEDVVTNQWVMVTGWFDNSSANKIYIQINDNVPTEFSYAGNNNTNGLNLTVGADGSGLTRFTGRLDELKFWKRVLTAQERTDLYNAGAGTTCCIQ